MCMLQEFHVYYVTAAALIKLSNLFIKHKKGKLMFL